MLANIRAALDDVLLILAVDDLFHPLDEQPVVVASQQVIPIVAPQDLDDVPTGAAESASSSWMILPLPRTGPSSRCRLQFTTKIRLSSFSREASVIAPSDLRLVASRRRPGTPRLAGRTCLRCRGSPDSA